MNQTTSSRERMTGRIESDGGSVSQSGHSGVIQQSRTSAEDIHDATICVVGLGYVGLPLAVHFAQVNYRVVGFDIDRRKVETLRAGIDTTGDLTDDIILDDDIAYTNDPTEIANGDYVIVAVPTPIDENEQPNLDFVENAGHTIGMHMRPGTTVILESTVYPGATRNVFVPALEESSGLSSPDDFVVGYSPERVTPGDPEHTLRDVVKIVSGQTNDALEDIAMLYESVVDVGVHRAPSIEVAEASKVVENVQRDLNIAFVNELSMAFERMKLDLDTHTVLEAARTKWNFHDYRPGLVGGHCIPVDPYFFTQCSKRAGFTPELMLTGREVNESVPEHVANITIKALNRCRKTLGECRVLILGLTYKANVSDIRTSKIGNVIKHLHEYEIETVGYDPIGDNEIMAETFGIDIQSNLSFSGYDAVIFATPHRVFDGIDLNEMANGLNANPALVDVTGALDPNAVAATGITYRRL